MMNVYMIILDSELVH